MVNLFRSRKRLLDIPSYPEDSPAQNDGDVSMSSKIKHVSPDQVTVFEEYCSYSTIHGTKYLGENGRHWLEKIWWIVAFAFSLAGCGWLIYQLYAKWEQSPVIVSFSERSTPIYEIPFPSVTICPEIKAKKHLIDFTKVYLEMSAKSVPPYNISDKEVDYMEAASQVCDAHLTDEFEIGAKVNGKQITEMLKNIAPTLKETMLLCKFRNKLEFCKDFFDEIITDEGHCFTFNMLNSRELYREGISKDFLQRNRDVNTSWSLDTGYDKSVGYDARNYPYRVIGAGARAGLFVLLRLYEENLDYICKGPVQGFKILLHPPGELPQLTKHYFRVPLLQEVLVSVKPNMITTSAALLKYHPERRQCFFNSERYLRFFKVYTQQNCELECLANYTLKVCGCVRFSMPRDNQTDVCGTTKRLCYDQAENDLLHEQYGIDTNGKVRNECNCLPSCTSIAYEAEVSQASYDWNRLKGAFNLTHEHPGMQPARLAIFFRENQFITSKRSELYGPIDFVANCGGLLGLFMGVSLLSIVEIIYHFSLRACCNLRKRRTSKATNGITLRPLLLDGTEVGQ